MNEKWGDDGMFDTALGMNPTIPVFNTDGTYYQPTSPTDIKNPVQQLKVNTSEGKRTYLLGTTDLKYDIWHNDNHNVSTTLSYSYNYIGAVMPAGHPFNIRNGIRTAWSGLPTIASAMMIMMYVL